MNKKTHKKPSKLSKPTIRCIECRSEFTEQEIEFADRCPKCKTETLPSYIKHDLKIDINWHELRLLCMWANNYARTVGVDALYTIECVVNRLRPYKPVDAGSLSLKEDIQTAADELGIDVEVIDEGAGTKTVVKPRGSKLIN